MTEMSRELQLSAAFVKLADTLIESFDVVDLLQTLVEKCATILDTEAAGLMLIDAAGGLQLVASTSEEASLVEMMQINAGGGPCVDCITTGKPISVGDIDKSGDRWPAFRREALKQGFQSMHATPLRLRGEVLGAMNLFSFSIGELGTTDVTIAQALADVATIGMLQERSMREQEIVAEQLQHALNSRILIEQAKGVVSENADTTMDVAFARIRTYARDNNLTLSSVARGIVDRTVELSALSIAKASPRH